MLGCPRLWQLHSFDFNWEGATINLIFTDRHTGIQPHNINCISINENNRTETWTRTTGFVNLETADCAIFADQFESICFNVFAKFCSQKTPSSHWRALLRCPFECPPSKEDKIVQWSWLQNSNPQLKNNPENAQSFSHLSMLNLLPPTVAFILPFRTITVSSIPPSHPFRIFSTSSRPILMSNNTSSSNNNVHSTNQKSQFPNKIVNVQSSIPPGYRIYNQWHTDQ